LTDGFRGGTSDNTLADCKLGEEDPGAFESACTHTTAPMSKQLSKIRQNNFDTLGFG